MFSNEVLLGSEFDPIGFLKHTLHLPDISTTTDQLTICMREVDDKIKAAVGAHFDEMLHEVDVSQRVAKDAVKLHSSVSTLSSSCARLSHTIEDSYTVIESSIHEMTNTNAALETLRAVQRIVAAVEKLPSADGDMNDISRCARRLADVDELISQHHDLVSGIHVIDAALSTITTVSSHCRQRAQEAVKQGLLSGRHSDVIVALQALSMIGSLGRVVIGYVGETKRETLKSVVKLDAQSIATTMAEQVDVTKAKEVLFVRMEQALKEIASRCQVLFTLHSLLEKQQKDSDAIRNTGGGTFGAAITTVAAGGDAGDLSSSEALHGAFADFSNALTTQLIEKFVRLRKKANISGVLILEYPRLYKCLASFASQAGGVLDMGATDTRSFLEKILLDLEKEYIGAVSEQHLDRIHKLISTMNDIMPPVGGEHAAVAASHQPHLSAQRLDCRSLIKVLTADLTAHRQEPHLAFILVRVATSTLKSVHDKLNEALAKVPGSYSPTLTAGQIFHTNLANCAAHLHNELISVVALIPVAAGGGGVVSPSSAGGGSIAAGALSIASRAVTYRVPTAPQMSSTLLHLRRAVEAFGAFHRRVVNAEVVEGGSIHAWSVAKRLLISCVDASIDFPSLPLGTNDKASGQKLPALVADAVEDLGEAVKVIVSRLSLYHRVGGFLDDARRGITSLVLWKGVLWVLLQPGLHGNPGAQFALSRLQDDLGPVWPAERAPQNLRRVYAQLLGLLAQFGSLGSEEASVSTRTYIYSNLISPNNNAFLRLSTNDFRASSPGAASAVKIVYLLAALHHLVAILPLGSGEGSEDDPKMGSTNPPMGQSAIALHTAMSLPVDQLVEVLASWVCTGKSVKDTFKSKLKGATNDVLKSVQATGTIPGDMLTDIKVMIGECVIDIDSAAAAALDGPERD